MSELRKANFDKVFFTTLTVVDWIDVFSRRDYADIVIGNLKYCQQYFGLEIYAYVLMTNHLHMVAAQKDGQLNDVLGRFKSFTAKTILHAIKNNAKESRREWLLHMFSFHAKFKSQDYHFWQPTNHPIALVNHEMKIQKINYTHMNPVRAGYVLEPEHWYFSSACPFSPIKILEL